MKRRWKTRKNKIEKTPEAVISENSLPIVTLPWNWSFFFLCKFDTAELQVERNEDLEIC